MPGGAGYGRSSGSHSESDAAPPLDLGFRIDSKFLDSYGKSSSIRKSLETPVSGFPLGVTKVTEAQPMIDPHCSVTVSPVFCFHIPWKMSQIFLFQGKSSLEKTKSLVCFADKKKLL